MHITEGKLPAAVQRICGNDTQPVLDHGLPAFRLHAQHESAALVASQKTCSVHVSLDIIHQGCRVVLWNSLLWLCAYCVLLQSCTSLWRASEHLAEGWLPQNDISGRLAHPGRDIKRMLWSGGDKEFHP